MGLYLGLLTVLVILFVVYLVECVFKVQKTQSQLMSPLPEAVIFPGRGGNNRRLLHARAKPKFGLSRRVSFGAEPTDDPDKLTLVVSGAVPGVLNYTTRPVSLVHDYLWGNRSYANWTSHGNDKLQLPLNLTSEQGNGTAYYALVWDPSENVWHRLDEYPCCNGSRYEKSPPTLFVHVGRQLIEKLNRRFRILVVTDDLGHNGMMMNGDFKTALVVIGVMFVVVVVCGMRILRKREMRKLANAEIETEAFEKGQLFSSGVPLTRGESKFWDKRFV